MTQKVSDLSIHLLKSLTQVTWGKQLIDLHEVTQLLFPSWTSLEKGWPKLLREDYLSFSLCENHWRRWLKKI
jgi:hypothetical protein